MITQDYGSPTKPIHVAIGTVKAPSFKDIIAITLVSVLPIAAAVLMQHPALRQSIKMRMFHIGRELCHTQADLLNKLGDKCAQEYNKARM